MHLRLQVIGTETAPSRAGISKVAKITPRDIFSGQPFHGEPPPPVYEWHVVWDVNKCKEKPVGTTVRVSVEEGVALRVGESVRLGVEVEVLVRVAVVVVVVVSVGVGGGVWVAPKVGGSSAPKTRHQTNTVIGMVGVDAGAGVTVQQ